MSTPLKAIREQCIKCLGSARLTKNCGGDKMLRQGDEGNVCYFFPYRQGKGRPSVKTIRKFCLECMGDSYELVKNCPTPECSVFAYHFGKKPKT